MPRSLTRTKVDMAKRGVQKVARMEEKDTHYDSQQEDRGADQFLVRLEDYLNFSHFVIFRPTCIIKVRYRLSKVSLLCCSTYAVVTLIRNCLS